MLALVGIGLDAKDISIKALEFLKNAQIVYADTYTSITGSESLKYISDATGKEIIPISRSHMEEKLADTIKDASRLDVAILVIGDPLVATTHHIILDEAASRGIETRVFHSSSIFSAGIGESGLDIYKFGPTTTIPFWSEHYKPTSFMDVIARNLANKEHTLVLFDLNSPTGTAPMSIEQAKQIINMADKEGILAPEKKVLILADIGRASQSIKYIEFSKIPSLARDLSGRMLSMIVPSQMSFAEEESVKRFS